jgi:ketosteroid isomerase-like protein
MSEQQNQLAELEALEHQREQAVLAADITTLERLLSPDMIYVHSSATAEDRDTYLQRVAQGYYVYNSVQSLQRNWRLYPDFALANGDLRIDVTVRGTAKIVMSRYLQVWAKTQGQWRMVSWQSTPIPQ